MPYARRAHCSGGAPPSTSWSGVLPPSVSCKPCAGRAHCSLGGFHSFSYPWMHAGVAHCLAEVAPYLPFPRAGCARCWVGGSPSSSIPRPCSWGARFRVWGSPSGPWLRGVGTRCQVRGPPVLLPLGGRTRTVWGGSAPRCCPPACRALGVRAARSCPPSPSPSAPGLPSPLWPRVWPLLPGAPRRLDRPPAPPTPVCRTCGASACRFRA